MKKFVQLATVALVLGAASNASAGVADKKAMRSADENIAKALGPVQQSCGASELKVEMKWDDFIAMTEANANALEADHYKSEWVLGHAGERMVAVLQSIDDLCSSDADYRAELAKLQTIVVMPKGELGDAKSEFSLEDEGTMNISAGHKMARSKSDFTNRIKALF